MSGTLSIVVSIFGLIGLGYVSTRSGLLATAVTDRLVEFVFRLAIPCLLFSTLATADFHGVSPWRIWGAYFIPFAVVWAVSQAVVRRVFGRDRRAGIVGAGSGTYSNGVLIGVPLIQAAFGEPGMIFLIIIVTVHLPIMMLVSMGLNEWVGTEDRTPPSRRDSFRRLALTLVAHPILIGVALGLLWRLTGWEIPTVLAAIIDPLALSAGPLALVASGMALVNYGIARQIKPAIALSVLKLFLLPVLVYFTAQLVGLPPIGVASLTLVAACPTGVNAYLVANRIGTGEALASNTILISTAAAVGSVTLWLALLERTLN